MNGSNGAASVQQAGINGAPAPIKRRVKKMVTNPFATARRPGQTTRPNGQPMPQPKPNGVPPHTVQRHVAGSAAIGSNAVSGFSDPAVVSGSKSYTDYKLVATKKDLLDGLRHHLMQLNTAINIDIRDPKQFSQPAHLHRRDPRANPPGAVKEEQVEIKDGMNAEEREALKVKNEQRKQERAANLAQIAPTQTTRKTANQKTKTKAVFKRDYTEEDKRRIQTNYEEKLPWHLEDFDNKHCFVGENQASASHRHVAFAFERGADTQSSRFRLVPVEKIYEFKPRRQPRKEMTLEEAEAAYKRRHPMPFLLEKQELDKEQRKKRQLEVQPKLFVGANKTNKYAGRTGDDADWDNDDDGGLFADDEEGDIIQVKDEDEALAEKRIKEDQLKANFFEVKEEHEYDQEEAEEEREEQQRKEQSRNYRKLLEKHERNYNHASDSEYSSSSDEEDEEERAKADAEKRANLEAVQNQLQPPSGSTTPSGRKDRSALHSDREGGKSKRKRPGSPYLSEIGSGTDTSARNKKPKTKHPSSHPVSRPGTPSNAAARIRGAGSDTDAAGTMSDSTARKLKLKHRGTSNMPSRANSPAPGITTSLPSRSGAASPSNTLPSHDEVREIIRKSLPQGMTIQELLKSVPHPKEKTKEFMALLLKIAKLEDRGNGRKVLKLRGNLPA